MAVLWLYRLLVPFAVLYMLLHPNCLKYHFQNKTRRGIWQISPLESLETYIHSIFLACLVLTGLCKWFLPTPGCQSVKTIYLDLIFFSYYGTVIAIVQLRLKFASITSLIYNSHQPLFPKTSHSLCNFTSHLMQS